MIGRLFSARHRALGWVLFSTEVVVLLAYVTRIDRNAPLGEVSAEITGPDRRRFGKSEAERRALFQELVRGEMDDQLRVRKQFNEHEVWNRNFDNYFHQAEAARYGSVAHRVGIPLWMAYLIVDEGMRAHWPPPPGVELRADDAPLVAVTRPLQKHALITVAPMPAPTPTLVPK